MVLLTLSLAFGLAALIGLSLGLLGSGGSIITLLVLVYVAGVYCGGRSRGAWWLGGTLVAWNLRILMGT